MGQELGRVSEGGGLLASTMRPELASEHLLAAELDHDLNVRIGHCVRSAIVDGRAGEAAHLL
jgi:hypothetical protein